MVFFITSYSSSNYFIQCLHSCFPYKTPISKFSCLFNFSLIHNISVVVLLSGSTVQEFSIVFENSSSSFFMLPIFSNPCITTDCYFFLGSQVCLYKCSYIWFCIKNRIILRSLSFDFKPPTFAYNILMLFDCFFFLDVLTFFEWFIMFLLLLS